MDKYYLDTNLRRWAMIQFSSYIWKQLEMKKHLAKTSTVHPILIKDTVPAEIREKLDKLPLPRREKDELKLAVGSMGTRIRKWLREFTIDKNAKAEDKFLEYIDHIHWTHLGCIDSFETNKSLYTSGLLPVTCDTWSRLCNDCNEECITDFWRIISQDETYFDVWREIRSIMFESEMSCYYWNLRMQDRLYRFKEKVEGMKDSVDELMFETTFNDNAFHTFVYFWNRLNKNQKKRMLEEQRDWLANVVLFAQINDDSWFYDCPQDTHSLMFVLQQYSLHGFDEFLVDMLRSSLMLGKMMLTWPCQDNFMPAMVDAWTQHDYIDYEPIMAKLLNLIDIEKAYLGDDSKARKLFCDLWDKDIPAFRYAIALDPLCELWEKKDIQLLTYVAVHQESEMERESLLDYYAGFHEHDLSNVDFVKELINEISKEVDVREWFRKVLAERGCAIDDL